MSILGLFCIFTTKSNDFALGVPLIVSLMGQKYANYIYLFAPFQLLVLNVLGFVCLELGLEVHMQPKSSWLNGWTMFNGGLSEEPTLVTCFFSNQACPEVLAPLASPGPLGLPWTILNCLKPRAPLRAL